MDNIESYIVNIFSSFIFTFIIWIMTICISKFTTYKIVIVKKDAWNAFETTMPKISRILKNEQNKK